MGEYVKQPPNRASSTPVVVGFTVLTIVVYLVDSSTIQQLTADDFIWEFLTIACCVLVLASPFLLSSLKRFMLGRAPSLSSVRQIARSKKLRNDARCGDGRSNVSDVPSTNTGTGQETIIDSGRPDGSDVPSTFAGTGQGTIIDSQRSEGMMQFIHAIDTAAKAADPHKAEKLFTEMQQAGFQLSVLVYNSVIQAHAKKGDVSMAEKWLRQMKAEGVEPNVVTYNMLMDTCAKKNDVVSAEGWFITMYEDGIDPHVTSFATVIHARAKCGDLQKAEDWLKEMKKFGVEPNVVIYNSLINASAREGHALSAERWLEEMMAAGIEPKATSYTSVVDAFAKAKNVKKGEKWIQKMSSAGIAPKVASYSAMIDACAEDGDPVRAEHWHKEMIDSGAPPSARSYRAVIDAFAKKGDVVAAELWLGCAEDAGVEIDVDVYCGVFTACAMVGDEDRAMRSFRQMQKKGFCPTTVAYSSLAQPLANRGDWETVELLLSEMTTAGIAMDNSFLCVLLLAYGSAKPQQRERAETIVRNAVTAGISMDDQKLAAVLSGVLGRSATESLLGELQDDAMFAAYAQDGNEDGAVRIFRQMQQKGIRPKAVAFSSLARLFAHRGAWEKVELLLSEMTAAGIAMDDYLLYALLHAYGNAKPQQRERAETATRNAVATGILVNDEKLTAVLSHVLGRSAALAFLCELTELMTPSGAPGLMPPSGSPVLMPPPVAPVLMPVSTDSGLLPLSGAPGLMPSSGAPGLMLPSGEPGRCSEAPAPSSLLEPKQLLGEWLDSLGNAVQVYSADAYEAKLMATISRPPRADANIPLKQLEGGWQCGNSYLNNDVSSEWQLHWVGTFGRISIWQRAHGNPQSS